MQFTLIVPPAFEASLGLMIGAGERTYRGKLWRVEIWAGELYPRILCNGARVATTIAPDHACKLANAVIRAFSPVDRSAA